MLNKFSLFCSMLLLSAIQVFSASASDEVQQEAVGHTSQDRFAHFGPTLHALAITRHDLGMIYKFFRATGMGIYEGGLIKHSPTTLQNIKFLTPKQIADYARAEIDEKIEEEEYDKYDRIKEQIEKRSSDEQRFGSVCAVLAAVIVCDPLGDTWSLVDRKVMEDRIRLLVLDEDILDFARIINAWMPILEVNLPVGSKEPLLSSLMKIYNESMRKGEIKSLLRQSSHYNTYAAARIEPNDNYEDSWLCSQILSEFCYDVGRLRLTDEGNLQRSLVKQSDEEICESITIVMKERSNFVGIILDLLDFAEKLKPDAEIDRQMKHVAELIRIVRDEMERDQKREYMNMLRKPNMRDMRGLSHQLMQIFDAHVIKFFN